jgi:TolB-like protein/DNA-binding SARP family transcriptional activator/Flp pilus assembly protein TadD
LLARAPDQRISRDRLIATLWPDSDQARGRNLLKVSTYVLRTELGESALLSAGDELRLNAEVIRADVVEFESSLEQADHARAVSLYRGPFLDGFFLSEAPEFEHWAERVRERLAGGYRKALEALAHAAESQGDFGGAAEWWKARTAHDPYDSRIAIGLMQALEASGNRAGALQHAAIHQRLLQEEFGIEPAPEVLALAERLRGDPAVVMESRQERLPPATPTPSTSPAAPEPTGEGSPAPPDPASAPSRRLPRPAVRYGIVALLLGAVLFGAIWLGRTRGNPSPPAPEPSIAVLPLANHSTDPSDAALADGMTAELISMLAKTGGLRVIASTSVFSFRNREIDVRSIADSLGVAHVLEGDLQKTGSRLRVQVRLVDARDGSTRWSETYDRELQDVFTVQNDIARAVARELDARLGGATRTPLRRPPTQNIAAYELYLRGSDMALLRSDSTARKGIEYLQQAIALDSMYAAAWAGLSLMYVRVAMIVAAPVADRARYGALAEQAARKAVALDDSLAEAHAILGVVRMGVFDFASAERHLMRAIELDPSRPLTHEVMVALHLWTGQPAEALAYAERALALDPLSPTARAELAHALLFNGRCDDALAELEKLAGLKPPLMRVAPIAALCYARKHMWPEAVAVLRPQAARGEPHALALLGYMLARAGQKEEALRIHAALLQRWRRRHGGAYQVALVYAGFDDRDQTFAWLDRSIADRSLVGTPGITPNFMIVGPLFEDLRRDPRFERLRGRLGLQKR